LLDSGVSNNSLNDCGDTWRVAQCRSHDHLRYLFATKFVEPAAEGNFAVQ
jgi:hypothetical protein